MEEILRPFFRAAELPPLLPFKFEEVDPRPHPLNDKFVIVAQSDQFVPEKTVPVRIREDILQKVLLKDKDYIPSHKRSIIDTRSVVKQFMLNGKRYCFSGDCEILEYTIQFFETHYRRVFKGAKRLRFDQVEVNFPGSPGTPISDVFDVHTKGDAFKDPDVLLYD